MLHSLLILVLWTAPDGAVEDLARAERAFAQTSREQGMVHAFFQWLAEDGIVFRPEPVNGRDFYKGRPEPNGELFWRPAYVEVTVSGDMGMSTGPFIFQPRGGDPAFGHFLSVWAKDADGHWRVLIDHGIGHEPWLEQDWPGQVETRPAGEKSGGSGSLTDLLARDAAYGDAVAKAGSWADAIAEVAAPDFHLYRQGHRPVLGRDSARASLKAEAGATWQAQGGRVAGSGDFGYTYGTGRYQGEGASRFVFLRVWRTGGQAVFQLVAELVTRLPAQ